MSRFEGRLGIKKLNICEENSNPFSNISLFRPNVKMFWYFAKTIESETSSDWYIHQISIKLNYEEILYQSLIKNEYFVQKFKILKKEWILRKKNKNSNLLSKFLKKLKKYNKK